MVQGVRATGMAVVGRKEGSLVMVYGWACEVVVLNAESLERVAIWRGVPEWGFPVQRDVQEGTGLYTITIGGEIQSWIVQETREKRSYVVGFTKEEGTGKLEINEQWGAVRGVKRAGEGYLVWQAGGVSLHVKDAEGFRKTKEIERGTAGIEVDGETVVVKTVDHGVIILILKGDSWEEVGEWKPSDELKDEIILGVSAIYNTERKEGTMAAISRETTWTADNGIDISIASFVADDPEWSVKCISSPFPIIN